MYSQELENFSEIRTRSRAYFCYLFNRNLPSNNPSISQERILSGLMKIKGEVKGCEGVYILDEKGIQVSPTYTEKGKEEGDIGTNRSDRAYYYRAMKERRCAITDPYPSLLTHNLSVTASQPVLDEDGKVVYIACLDMSINAMQEMFVSGFAGQFFRKFMRWSYMGYAIALLLVALLMFVKGIENFVEAGLDFQHITIENMFESTILLTLSLAIFDLVKTLFDEEVMGRHHRDARSAVHKTMIRFLGSIIIALSIEALMLVFKFAITDPEKLINAVYIIGGVALLLIGLAFYIRFSQVDRR